MRSCPCQIASVALVRAETQYCQGSTRLQCFTYGQGLAIVCQAPGKNIIFALGQHFPNK